MPMIQDAEVWAVIRSTCILQECPEDSIFMQASAKPPIDTELTADAIELPEEVWDLDEDISWIRELRLQVDDNHKPTPRISMTQLLTRELMSHPSSMDSVGDGMVSIVDQL